MKILSIDVGMKHLAFCLFSVSSKETFTILAWDTIDLCQKEVPCCSNVKTGKKCARTSKYYKENKYYCKIHAKNSTFKVPTTDLKPTRIARLKVHEIKSICKKMGIELPKKAKKNNYLELLQNKLTTSYLNFVERVDARQISLLSYGHSIKQQFENIFHEYDLDQVLIENQVGPLALRMKILQGMIMQHFIEHNCPIIKTISPANKLKGILGTNKKTTYAQRKKISIDETSKFIAGHHSIASWQTAFHLHTKKDDLADAFLQGLWYLRDANIISF